METDNIEIKTLSIAVASIAFIEGLVIFLSSVRQIDPLLITGWARVLEILIIFIVVVTWGKGLPSIGLETSTIISGIKKGLLWSAGFGLLIGLALLIWYSAGINPLAHIQPQHTENSYSIVLFLLVGCIIGPVAEELFFRGIIYGFFRRWGATVALILTTIIFILAHQITGTIPLTQAVGGIIFARSYEIEKSLMAPIIIHILGNTALFTVSLFS